MSAFALVIPPACLSTHLQQLTQRSPTTYPHPKTYSLSGLITIVLPDYFRERFRSLRERKRIAFGDADTSAASVHGLAPLHLPRRPTRLVSYYAFFKGWLLLSQPPSCLCLPTSFPT
jgi:hypothetical protein